MTKTWVYVGVALVVSHGLAYGWGRYLTPANTVVIEKVRVETVEKQVVVVQERVRVEKVVVESETQKIHREESTTVHPNGLTETHKTEDIGIATVINSHDIQYVDRVVEKETVKTVEKVVEKEKIVEAQKPQWRAGPMVGYDLGRWSQPGLALSYGAMVERRVLGPVSIGVWGLSSAVAGVTATIEF